MTTDLEKQFFNTFGIEPITQAVWNSTETKWKNFESWEEYPQITDRILLELICFNNMHYVTLEDLICPEDIETIKESVLKKFIERNKIFVEEGYSGFCVKAVQELFKGE